LLSKICGTTFFKITSRRIRKSKNHFFFVTSPKLQILIKNVLLYRKRTRKVNVNIFASVKVPGDRVNVFIKKHEEEIKKETCQSKRKSFLRRLGIWNQITFSSWMFYGTMWIHTLTRPFSITSITGLQSGKSTTDQFFALR
jgi:hypothetical protein